MKTRKEVLALVAGPLFCALVAALCLAPFLWKATYEGEVVHCAAAVPTGSYAFETRLAVRLDDGRVVYLTAGHGSWGGQGLVRLARAGRLGPGTRVRFKAAVVGVALLPSSPGWSDFEALDAPP